MCWLDKGEAAHLHLALSHPHIMYINQDIQDLPNILVNQVSFSIVTGGSRSANWRDCSSIYIYAPKQRAVNKQESSKRGWKKKHTQQLRVCGYVNVSRVSHQFTKVTLEVWKWHRSTYAIPKSPSPHLTLVNQGRSHTETYRFLYLIMP